MDVKINAFAMQVQEKMRHVRTLSGAEQEEANNELSVFISQQMGALLAEGANVMALQDALRAATDDVPQTYAPDADDAVLNEEMTMMQLSETELATLFFAVETSFIEDYANGTLNKDTFMQTLLQCPMLSSRYYEATLSAIAKTDEQLSSLFFGGEIIADETGEAFVFQAIEGTLSGLSFSMCDPALFIPPNDVKEIASTLATVQPSTLLKFTTLHQIKKAFIPAKAFDKQDMINDYNTISTFFGEVSKENKGVITFQIY